jgi:hypothetical protein
MKHIKLFEDWKVSEGFKYDYSIDESLNIVSIFKKKQTVDSYLDMRDFFREKLGEKYEEDIKKKKKLFDKAKEETINVNHIIPNQEYLNKEIITKYQLTQDKLPLGVMFGNDVVLFDGHHRIAAEILNGAKEIKMLIIKA